jgi:hypothetical protein
MKGMIFVATILATTTAFAQKPSKGVWTWSKQCGSDHKLGVKVSLNKKILYQGVLPICRGDRAGEDGQAEFRFSGGHFFQGEYRTVPTELIEGDIWQAGGGDDGLILGISFDNKKQILLNTLHVAKPDQKTSTEIDKGLFIVTYRVSGR